MSGYSISGLCSIFQVDAGTRDAVLCAGSLQAELYGLATGGSSLAGALWLPSDVALLAQVPRSLGHS
jgi:hypothetical protein